MATALVGSPFDHSDVYLSVIRNGVIYKTVLHDTAGAPHVSFRVTPDMAPNAALEAVVVRRGRKLASVKPGSLDSLSRVGVAGFDIDMSDRYLRIGIVPQKARLAPGATQHVQFTLRDTHGRGLRGKIVAMAVNEAVLQLSGYRLPDLVQTIFADQPISTRFADNRENVTLRTAQAPVEKGFGFGGGFLEGAAGTRVRTNFLPLAYYGAITTDASGNAAASFAVPDDLTTWRVMAVAIAQDDAHFGTADATFVSTLPLMANPLLPQFARPGDEMNVGASVMNQTGAAGALDVRGTLAGALRFANGLVVQETHTQAPGIAAYRFPVTAGTPAPSTVAFRAGLGSASDAFSVPFEVTDRNVTESVIESGATSTTADIPIAFDRPGTLSVTVANSVVPQFAVPAARALQNEGVGISDEYASRVVIAASLRSLQAAYHLRFDVDAAKLAQTNVRDLVALQRGDGGFSAFAGGRQSDAFGSAFALEALAYAAADGVTVDSSVLASAKRFAADALANPSRFSRCDTALCKAQMRFSMLWSLAAAGDRRTEFLPQIFAARASLDDAAQIRLARYLLATPGWQKAGSQLADELTQTLYLTGRYASANLESPWGWLGTDVDAQAQMLHLLVERKAPSEQIDGAIRALLAQRCACGWPSLDATAAAVRALGAYAATAPLKPVRVSVRAGNATIGEAEFSATPSSRTFVAPTASLHGGKLTVASSGGTAHYLALYTYAPANDAAGALSAFRVTRTISDVGASASRATMDLAALASPVTLDAGRVFDIGLRVAVDHPVSRLVIEDPLPAGFEAVDATFKTANPSIAAQSDAWQIDSRTIYRDRVMAFAQHLEPGVYEMHYLVRSVTPGRYRWPGASAYLQDAPEQFGRTASAVLELR